MLAAWGAAPVLAQTASDNIGKVNWQTSADGCLNQIYQLIGVTSGAGGVSQTLRVMNPRTVQWDQYAVNSTQSNAFAYLPDRRQAMSSALSGPSNAQVVQIYTVNESGVSTPVGAAFATPTTTATYTGTSVATGAQATYRGVDGGAAASGGYDETNKLYWMARATTPNVFHVVNPATGYTQQEVNFGFNTTDLSPHALARAYVTTNGASSVDVSKFPGGTTAIANGSTGTGAGGDGSAQMTDIVVYGNKVYAVAMNSLFVYTFSMDPSNPQLVDISNVSYKRIDLGDQFPLAGTFGSVWLTKSPSGAPVIYASLNDNVFTDATPGVVKAGTPKGSTKPFAAGDLFRIENIDSAQPKASREELQSVLAPGGDGYNCSSANAMWLLEVADDVNYTPINTAVLGNWMANDNLFAAELHSPAGLPQTTTQGGSITLSKDGTYNYTPASGFTGVDTYQYEVCDNFAGGPTACKKATITVYVDGPPGIAQDDTEKTLLDTDVTINVLENDVVPLAPGAKPTVATSQTNGTVVVNEDGTVTYKPRKTTYKQADPACTANCAMEVDVPGFTGTDTFTYTVVDTQGVSHTQTVTVIVGPLGAAPDRYTTSADTAITTVPVTTSPDTSTSLSKLTAPAGNDVYPAGSTFALTGALSNPAAGTLTDTSGLPGVLDVATGGFIFTPASGFSGTVTFPYEVCQPALKPAADPAQPPTRVCATSIVTIEVPGAVDDRVVTSQNTPVSGSVVGNDSSNVKLFTPGALSDPGAGKLVLNPDGSYSFTPTTGYSGTVTVPYQACLPRPDETSCANAVLTIVVPGASDDVYTTPHNTPISAQVGVNDAVPPTSTFTMTGPLSNPAAGTVSMQPNGTYTFTPTNGFSGTVTFPYQACLPAPDQAACTTASPCPWRPPPRLRGRTTPAPRR